MILSLFKISKSRKSVVAQEKYGWLEINLKYITLKIIEKTTPCWLFKLMDSESRGDLLYLFNSQIPLLLFSENSLKFVDAHQVFLRHEWLQDIKLGDSNRFTTWPSSRLFSSVLKYVERENVASLAVSKIATFITHIRRKKSKRFLASIFSRSRMQRSLKLVENLTLRTVNGVRWLERWPLSYRLYCQVKAT